MKKSSVLNNAISPSEVKELNKATEKMRQNRLQRFGIVGDVDGYLQFLEERQKLFDAPPKTAKRLVIEKSSIL